MSTPESDVAIVGGGVAGLTAATFTARHDLTTVVYDAGGSILRRNAHLENVPGFPGGVNARLLLDLLAEQAERAGCERRTAEVTGVTRIDDADASDGRFRVETADGEVATASFVVAATKNAVGYLEGLDGVGIVDHGKQFVEVDERGRTGVKGCYAAGRLAGKPHQAAVAAGHGAEVAVTLLEDCDEPFYHDWVAPEGYFTGRGREVPPGCEEIDDRERAAREREGLDALREHLSDPTLEPPEQHPDVE